MTYSTQFRPQIHISPPVGWLNDANGLIYVDGIYHVFYQADPTRLWFGRMLWGHVSSVDLLSWVHHEPALVPSGSGPDVDGCWTGCIVRDGDAFRALYTGVTSLGNDRWTQQLCLASAADHGLVVWHKDPTNPQKMDVPDELEIIALRDPYVWREADGRWRMVIGTGFGDGRAGVLALHSEDLHDWTYDGVLFDRSSAENDPVWTGRIWECPSLVKIGADYLLVFSVWDDTIVPTLHYAVAVSGRLDAGRLLPRRMQRFDWGPHCYAPALFQHPDGRTLAWAWCWEALTEAGRAQQGWAGCLTMPRELSLDDAGGLVVAPLRELAGRRASGVEIMADSFQDDTRLLLADFPSGPVDVEVDLAVATAGTVEITILASPDDAERTVVRFDAGRRWLELDTRRSSLWPEAIGGVYGGPVELEPGEHLHLRLIRDGSIVEVFANQHMALSVRVYPTRQDSLGAYLLALGSPLERAKVTIWSLVGGPASG